MKGASKTNPERPGKAKQQRAPQPAKVIKCRLPRNYTRLPDGYAIAERSPQ